MSELTPRPTRSFSFLQVLLMGTLSFLLGGLVFTVAPKVLPKNNCGNLLLPIKSADQCVMEIRKIRL